MKRPFRINLPAIVYTIYYDPGDFPGSYVVRPYTIEPDGTIRKGEAFTADTLEGARSVLPKHVHRFVREDDDPEHILETWI